MRAKVVWNAIIAVNVVAGESNMMSDLIERMSNMIKYMDYRITRRNPDKCGTMDVPELAMVLIATVEETWYLVNIWKLDWFVVQIWPVSINVSGENPASER